VGSEDADDESDDDDDNDEQGGGEGEGSKAAADGEGAVEPGGVNRSAPVGATYWSDLVRGLAVRAGVELPEETAKLEAEEAAKKAPAEEAERTRAEAAVAAAAAAAAAAASGGEFVATGPSIAAAAVAAGLIPKAAEAAVAAGSIKAAKLAAMDATPLPKRSPYDLWVIGQAKAISRAHAKANASSAPEPTRNKTHWDHVLEEMEYIAKDFMRCGVCGWMDGFHRARKAKHRTQSTVRGKVWWAKLACDDACVSNGPYCVYWSRQLACVVRVLDCDCVAYQSAGSARCASTIRSASPPQPRIATRALRRDRWVVERLRWLR
jgi:hypothetical protein